MFGTSGCDFYSSQSVFYQCLLTLHRRVGCLPEARSDSLLPGILQPGYQNKQQDFTFFITNDNCCLREAWKFGSSLVSLVRDKIESACFTQICLASAQFPLRAREAALLSSLSILEIVSQILFVFCSALSYFEDDGKISPSFMSRALAPAETMLPISYYANFAIYFWLSFPIS